MHSNLKQKKGFTIIELLVVVALVSAITSIVLSNTTTYIKKSKRTAVIAEISNLLIFGAQHFSNNGSYSGLCADPEVATKFSQAITRQGGTLSCATTGTNKGYCLCATLPDWTVDSHVFCADNLGFKDEYVNNCSNACTGTGFCRY